MRKRSYRALAETSSITRSHGALTCTSMITSSHRASTDTSPLPASHWASADASVWTSAYASTWTPAQTPPCWSTRASTTTWTSAQSPFWTKAWAFDLTPWTNTHTLTHGSLGTHASTPRFPWMIIHHVRLPLFTSVRLMFGPNAVAALLSIFLWEFFLL